MRDQVLRASASSRLIVCNVIGIYSIDTKNKEYVVSRTTGAKNRTTVTSC